MVTKKKSKKTTSDVIKAEASDCGQKFYEGLKDGMPLAGTVAAVGLAVGALTVVGRLFGLGDSK